MSVDVQWSWRWQLITCVNSPMHILSKSATTTTTQPSPLPRQRWRSRDMFNWCSPSTSPKHTPVGRPPTDCLRHASGPQVRECAATSSAESFGSDKTRSQLSYMKGLDDCPVTQMAHVPVTSGLNSSVKIDIKFPKGVESLYCLLSRIN